MWRKGNYAANVKIILPWHLGVFCGHKPYAAITVPNNGHETAEQGKRKVLTRGYMRRYYIYRHWGTLPEEVFMAKRRSPKAEALLRSGTLNPHPERVRDPFFLENDFFDPKDLVQVKYEMFRKTEVEGEAVAKAAAAFGFSRPSFYQARRALEQQGVSGLIPQRRGPKQARKLTEPVMAFIEQALEADASLSMADVVRKVEERFEVRVHRRSIERALVRRHKKGR
jgi:transposase